MHCMQRTSNLTRVIGLGLFTLLVSSLPAVGQDRDRDRDRDGDRPRGGFTRLEHGTTIPVRVNESIDVQRKDNRVYYGIVDQDIRGDNGRIAIQRGSNAELIVRVAPDNDLILTWNRSW